MVGPVVIERIEQSYGEKMVETIKMVEIVEIAEMLNSVGGKDERFCENCSNRKSSINGEGSRDIRAHEDDRRGGKRR